MIQPALIAPFVLLLFFHEPEVRDGELMIRPFLGQALFDDVLPKNIKSLRIQTVKNADR